MSRVNQSVVITNARIMDGTGAPPVVGSVRIQEGYIQEMIPADFTRSSDESIPCEVIDLNGAYLAPGFIDVHTHSDIHVLHCPNATSAIRQGVTTEVIGNCGFSPFPVNDQSRSRLTHEVSTAETNVTWTDLNGFKEAVETQGTAINLVPLLGHGQLRATVCGYETTADSHAIAVMMKHVECAVEQGAWGLSSGLEYAPGSFADMQELSELCQPFRTVDGLYTTHIRNEGETLLEAIQEAIEVAERAEVKLQISHLKVSGRVFWGRIDATLDMIHAAMQRGVRMAFDRYPYLAVATHMAIFLPNQLWEGGTEAFLERLRNDRPTWEAYVRERILQRSDFSGVLVTDSGKADRAYQGKSLERIAAESGTAPERCVLDILLESEGTAAIACFSMNDAETDKILAHPSCFIGSDGMVHDPHSHLGRLCPHPRSYGSFARFLGHYVRDRRLVDLPEAIRKMTSAPAIHFGLPNRGVIRPGAVADLVAFDLDAVDDPAEFGDPHHPATGFHDVWVNGEAVIREGIPTGALPGKVLRRG